MKVFEGKCSKCGKIYYSHRKGDIIVCDCWRYCPLCGAEMTPYTPESNMALYGFDGKRDLKILMVCLRHTPPFYSSQKPVEVEFT